MENGFFIFVIKYMISRGGRGVFDNKKSLTASVKYKKADTSNDLQFYFDGKT